MPRRDEIPCDGGEVLGNQVSALSHRLGVPPRAVLAAAADVGHHIRAAAGQPQPAEHTVVARRSRHFETAVAAQQGRSRVGRVPVPDHEVRNLRAVLGGGEMLCDSEVVGVEKGRRAT